MLGLVDITLNGMMYKSVLDQQNDLCGRKVKEGIQIRLTNKKLSMNRDEGRDLSPEWFAIMKKILHGRLQWSYDTLRIAS